MVDDNYLLCARRIKEAGRRLGRVFHELSRGQRADHWHLQDIAAAEALLYELGEREGWLGIALRKLDEA